MLEQLVSRTNLLVAVVLAVSIGSFGHISDFVELVLDSDWIEPAPMRQIFRLLSITTTYACAVMVRHQLQSKSGTLTKPLVGCRCEFVPKSVQISYSMLKSIISAFPPPLNAANSVKTCINIPRWVVAYTLMLLRQISVVIWNVGSNRIECRFEDIAQSLFFKRPCQLSMFISCKLVRHRTDLQWPTTFSGYEIAH